MTTRVLLADDHILFAQALAQLLSERFEVVDVVADGRALQVSARKHKPDVIVTDITMPLMGGIESVQGLRNDSFMPKIIFLTMHADTELARECFACGASAFLCKQFSYEELIAAVDTVMSGRLYLSPNIAGGLVDSLRTPTPEKLDGGHLTSRQKEILQLFAEGRSTKEIASVTELSTRTIEWHKYRIMRILRARRSAELVQHAVRMKLVS